MVDCDNGALLTGGNALILGTSLGTTEYGLIQDNKVHKTTNGYQDTKAITSSAFVENLSFNNTTGFAVNPDPSAINDNRVL